MSNIFKYNNTQYNLDPIDFDRAEKERRKRNEEITLAATIIFGLAFGIIVVSPQNPYFCAQEKMIWDSLAANGTLGSGVLLLIRLADPGVHYEDRATAREIIRELARAQDLPSITKKYSLSKLSRYNYIDFDAYAQIKEGNITTGNFNVFRDHRLIEHLKVKPNLILEAKPKESCPSANNGWNVWGRLTGALGR